MQVDEISWPTTYAYYALVNKDEHFGWGDTNPHRNIVNRLSKYSDITVLNTLEGEKPDVMLVFRRGRFFDPGGFMRGPQMYELGWGVAFRIENGNTMRILWRFKDKRLILADPRSLRPYRAGFLDEKDPSTNFARNFVELHMKLCEKE